MAFKNIKIVGNGTAQTVLTNTSILEGVTTGLVAYNSTAGALSFSLLIDGVSVISESVDANTSYRLPDKVNIPVNTVLTVNAATGLDITVSAYQTAIDVNAALSLAQTSAAAAAQSAIDAVNALPAGTLNDITPALDKAYSSTKIESELTLKEDADATILKDADIGVSVVGVADIGSTVQAYDADTSKLDVAETRTANINLLTYAETKVAMAANDVDLSLGNIFTKTISVGTTLTISNPAASGKGSAFTLILTNGGAAVITFPASVKWAAATAPTLTAAGIDVLTFTTVDGGTNWYGIAAGIGMA